MLENVFDSPVPRLFQGVMSLFFTGLLACRKSFVVRRQLAPYLIPGSGYDRKTRLRVLVGALFAFIPIATVRKAALFFNRLCRDDSSCRVSVPSGRKYFFGDQYDRAIFADARPGVFAGLPVPLPLRVESYLDHCYGNWRQLPEVPAGTHFFCRLAIDNWRQCFRDSRSDIPDEPSRLIMEQL